MSLAIVLRAEAQAEFDEAFDLYDGERVGLGLEFIAEIQRAFDRIAVDPELHPVVFGDIRKRVVRRFPYSIFYRAHSDRIEVIAVFHASRDPIVWQRRA